jgi:fructose-1,6-bisphosphatase/inositol monophosphatase family enzyme
MDTQYTDDMRYVSSLTVAAYHETIEKSGHLHIQQKGIRDLVTSLDFAIENYIVANIQRDFPDDAIIAEETHHHILTDKRTWVIDPIDGTVNFARGFPFFGVQVALMVNKEPVASSIYLPALKEHYTACLGGGSFLDGRRIAAGSHKSVGEAILTIGDFGTDQQGDNARQIEGMKSLAGDVLKIKMFGAACYDFVTLARGISDIVVMFDFGLWDIMPGLLIAREAGVTFRTLTGNPLNEHAKNLVGSNNPTLVDFVISKFEACGILQAN